MKENKITSLITFLWIILFYLVSLENDLKDSCLSKLIFNSVTLLFFKDFIYFFERESKKEREHEPGGGAGSPMWGSKPGP